MSSSHNSSASSSSATQPTASMQISTLGSNDPGWLNELQTLGYTPSSGSWNGITNASASGVMGGSNPQINATAGGQSQAASLLQLLANQSGKL
jgi:hypothetical protein